RLKAYRHLPALRAALAAHQSPNELNTTLTPHSIIPGDACFAYFNKIWGIPAVADRGGIKHPQRQMAAALVRVDVVELPDPDRKGGAPLRTLRERCSRRSRRQRAGKRRAARGNRPPLHQDEKFRDEARHIVIAHARVLSSIGRERKAAAPHCCSAACRARRTKSLKFPSFPRKRESSRRADLDKAAHDRALV